LHKILSLKSKQFLFLVAAIRDRSEEAESSFGNGKVWSVYRLWLVGVPEKSGEKRENRKTQEKRDLRRPSVAAPPLA
jgi:hypothetical protein